MLFKIIAILLLTLATAFDLFLAYRSYKARNNPIPEELSDVYDTETYLKWKSYKAEHIKVNVIFNLISYAISLVFIASNLLALIVGGMDNPYNSSIVVVAVITGVNLIPDFIHEYISTMKIEAKYGFNKSSLKTLIADFIKTFVISTALVIGLLCLFILLYSAMSDYVLLLFTGIVFVIALFMNFLYPLFSKIFNKFVSLEEGELRTKLIGLLTKHGYHVKDIKVMDASRRTTKSNAYFAGFGKTKTIVLYDNLLKVMSEDEIVAIFSHEMGHGLHKDTLKNSIFSILTIAIVVTLAWLLAKFPEIYADFGFAGVNYGFGFILLLSCVLPVVTPLMEFLSSLSSRKAEYRADEQAVEEGYGEVLISALKKLFREDFGDLNPDRIIVTLTYSHPTLLQRIKHIRETEEKRNNPANPA